MGQAIKYARKGSTIVLVAVFGKLATVDLAVLNDHELDLDTSMMYRHEDYIDCLLYTSPLNRPVSCRMNHIPANVDNALVQINVFPFQAQYFTRTHCMEGLNRNKHLSHLFYLGYI